MVTTHKTRRILCTVIRVFENHGAEDRRARPSDMLPWADPYIASLIDRLQDEVRNERAIAGNQKRCEAGPAPSDRSMTSRQLTSRSEETHRSAEANRSSSRSGWQRRDDRRKP